MKLKLNILFLLISLMFSPYIKADEEFLLVKGELIDELTEEPVVDYTVKVVQDRLDSNEVYFKKSKFKVWLPANRKSKVYFIKDGYILKHVYVDASLIPSRAYKKKQQIELEITMTPQGAECKQDFTKPIYTADYEAKSNAFTIEKTSMECETPLLNKNYEPPFPTPVDTYNGAKPTTKSLGLTSTYSKSKAKSGDYSSFLQGILFADMNYCLFNERTNDANDYLSQLKELDNSKWGNIKPFDSPEYGKIVLRTVNREQSMDTLFAFGAYIETSRLVFNSFTSDSKVLVHLKKLKIVLEEYSGMGLNSNQKDILDQLKAYVPLIEELEKKYTEGLRHNLDFDMSTDEHFIQLKELNQSLYESLVG